MAGARAALGMANKAVNSRQGASASSCRCAERAGTGAGQCPDDGHGRAPNNFTGFFFVFLSAIRRPPLGTAGAFRPIRARYIQRQKSDGRENPFFRDLSPRRPPPNQKKQPLISRFQSPRARVELKLVYLYKSTSDQKRWGGFEMR